MLFIKAGAKTPNIFFINDEYVYAKSISDAVSLYKDKIAIYNEISSIIPVIRYTKELQHSYIIIDDDNHVENDNYFLYKFELPTDYPGNYQRVQIVHRSAHPELVLLYCQPLLPQPVHRLSVRNLQY